jgi:general secretion pathway protein B
VSFILDALRKSDAERQRQGAPGLADIRYGRRPVQRSTWVPILVLVLAANLLVMGWLWFRERPSGSPAAPVAATAAAPVAAPPAAPAPLPAAPAPLPLPAEVRSLAEEAAAVPEGAGELSMPGDPDISTGDAEAAAPPLPGDEEPDPLLAGFPAPPPVAAVQPPPASTSRIRDDPGLPTSQQLIAAGTLRVPDMSLELHVYSGDPERRFVIINGRRYREGAALTEGPVVEAINAEGVILDNQGTRFILLPK